MPKFTKEVLARFHLINDTSDADFSLVHATTEGEEIAVLCLAEDGKHHPVAIILTDEQIAHLDFPNAQLIKED